MEDWTLKNRASSINPDLLTSGKILVTPHIGAAVTAVRHSIEYSSAVSIITFLNGYVPETAINPEANSN